MKAFKFLFIVLFFASCSSDESTCITCTINAIFVDVTETGCEDGSDVKSTIEALGIKSDTTYKSVTLDKWKADRIAEGYSCK